MARVHHLHVWAVSTTDTALTVHLVMPGGHPGNDFLADAQKSLKADFGISHATIQIEIGHDVGSRAGEKCPLDRRSCRGMTMIMPTVMRHAEPTRALAFWSAAL